MRLGATADRVVVRPKDDGDPVTPAGLILPPVAQERISVGEVVAVGSGTLRPNAGVVVPDCRPGDVVMYDGLGGDEFLHEWERYVSVPARHLLARLDGDRYLATAGRAIIRLRGYGLDATTRSGLIIPEAIRSYLLADVLDVAGDVSRRLDVDAGDVVWITRHAGWSLEPGIAGVLRGVDVRGPVRSIQDHDLIAVVEEDP